MDNDAETTGAFAAERRFDAALGTDTLVLRHVDTATPENSLEAAIAPAFGSNLFRLRSGAEDIIYCDPALLRERDWTGTFVLWPLPNRVRDKRFTFEGQTYSLETIRRKQGNAVLIHGLVDDQPWHATPPHATDRFAEARTEIAITPDSPMFRVFPFPSSLTLRFVLTPGRLRVAYTIANTGAGNLPFGFALHPYFATLAGAAETYVTLPGDSVMESDAEILPTGRLLPVGGTPFDLRRPTAIATLQLDHVYTDLHPDEPAIIDYRSRGLQVRLRASADCTHMVLYTHDATRGYICFENQTGATDMINLDAEARRRADPALEHAAHLLILPPGATHDGYIEYEIVRRANRSGEA